MFHRQKNPQNLPTRPTLLPASAQRVHGLVRHRPGLVFRWLQRFRKRFTPGRSTSCQARQRLGLLPLRLLAHQVVQLLAKPSTAHAWYAGMRLMALDGFVTDRADTPANVRAFGRPKGGRTAGAFPQARVLALCAVGTHVLWRWLVKRLACGESRMAATLLRFLRADMLLLGDRNFLSYAHVQRVRQRRSPTDVRSGPGVRCATAMLVLTNTLKILRCRLPEVPRSRQGLKRWYADLLVEIGEEILEPRRDRINPRVIRQKVKKGPKKRPEHRKHPQPSKKFHRSIVMLR